MASVELREVRKSFGQLTVIQDVSVSMADGEFVVLVGPSGCGKSTLLRMICGLEDVTGGGVFIGDKRVNDLQPKDRDIAMVFQSYALYPHMTVAENMGFSMRLRGVPRAKINARVIEAAEMLNLQTLTDRFPRQLSGGQRQRVAMGRAMVRDPEVFLFDEPLSNLDAKMRVQMRSEIKDLHQRLGTTIVYVTHDQVEAMTLADKIVVMRDGAVEQVGAPLDLYDQPSNVFVAGFIGSPAMNFIRGRVDLTDGAPHLTLTAANSLQLPEIAFTAPAREVIVGLRPEHIRITDHGVEATVASVEPMGSETQVNFSIGAHALVGIFRERIKLTRGEIVQLSADPANIHIFDAGSEQRL